MNNVIDVRYLVDVARSLTKVYWFKYVDLTKYDSLTDLMDHFSNPYSYIKILKQISDVVRFSVNTNWSSEQTINKLLAPLSFYMHTNGYNLNNVSYVHVYVLSEKEYEALRIDEHETGCTFNEDINKHWILLKDTDKLIESLFHEFTHVIDKIKNRNFIDHVDLPYELRYYEINAFNMAELGLMHYYHNVINPAEKTISLMSKLFLLKRKINLWSESLIDWYHSVNLTLDQIGHISKSKRILSENKSKVKQLYKSCQLT